NLRRRHLAADVPLSRASRLRNSSSKTLSKIGGRRAFAMAREIVDTTCCVVGGGPAGMMLGYLLARRGVEVIVMEKHGDFFRDFRGDTVHPSTLEVLKELGLLEEFLSLPHQKVESVGVRSEEHTSEL